MTRWHQEDLAGRLLQIEPDAPAVLGAEAGGFAGQSPWLSADTRLSHAPLLAGQWWPVDQEEEPVSLTFDVRFRRVVTRFMIR
jgi:hypothetical protein